MFDNLLISNPPCNLRESTHWSWKSAYPLPRPAIVDYLSDKGCDDDEEDVDDDDEKEDDDEDDQDDDKYLGPPCDQDGLLTYIGCLGCLDHGDDDEDLDDLDYGYDYLDHGDDDDDDGLDDDDADDDDDDDTNDETDDDDDDDSSVDIETEWGLPRIKDCPWICTPTTLPPYITLHYIIYTTFIHSKSHYTNEYYTKLLCTV